MKAFKNVLVVDDDPILRVIAKSYFEDRGSEQVFEADNGLKALEIVQEKADTIDFILCDINMPRMDGVEFLSKINDSDYSGPIVILSATASVIVKMARELGEHNNLNIVGTLQKPLTPAMLGDLIANMDAVK